MLLPLFAALLTVGQPAADPNEALLQIQQFRVAEIRKDPKNTTEQFRNKIALESKKLAEAALANFTLDSAKPEDCLPWMNLLSIAERYTQIPPTFDKLLTTEPSQSTKSAGISILISSFYQSKNYGLGIAKIDNLESISPIDSPSIIKAAGDFVLLQANQTSEDSIAFLTRLIQKVSSPNTLEETRSHAIALANYYSATAEIEFRSGNQTGFSGRIAEGIADPRLNQDEQNLITRTKNRLTLVGSPAPEIESAKAIGTYSNLAAFKGKVIVISFFANWSLYSHYSFPTLRKLNDDLKSQGLEVISVTKFYGYMENEYSLDENDEFNRMKSFTNDQKINWPVVFAPAETQATYGLNALPFTVLIDRKGIVRKIQTGYDAESLANFRKEVETALKETA